VHWELGVTAVKENDRVMQVTSLSRARLDWDTSLAVNTQPHIVPDGNQGNHEILKDGNGFPESILILRGHMS
jgi:hypothetical protein